MTFDPDIELADTSVEGNIASDILAIKTAIELGIPKEKAEQMIRPKEIQAYGTSEGVTKSWDTRGRGRHPREKSAQPSKEPGYVGPTEEFYHGTISENLAAILKQGLRQNVRQKFNLKVNPYAEGSLKSANGFVYLTKDKELAQWYGLLKQRYMDAPPGSSVSIPYIDAPARGNALRFYKPTDAAEPLPGSKPAIVTLEIPMSEEKNFHRDPKSPGMPAWMVQGKIPPKYLSQIEIYDGQWKSWWTRGKGRVSAEQMVQVYLVFYGPTAHIAQVVDSPKLSR